MRALSLFQRVVRGYAIGIGALVVLVPVASFIGGRIADDAGGNGFEGLGTWLMWVFGAAVVAVVLQIPLGRLVGLGWAYGFLLVALAIAWSLLVFGVLRADFDWLTTGVAATPLLAAVLTGRSVTRPVRPPRPSRPGRGDG